MLGRTSSLDNNYTVLGRVVSGMDAVDAIAPGEPPEAPTTIVHAWLGDAPAPPVVAPVVAPPPPSPSPPSAG
jgi:peptidylprolyl isomerase